MPEPVVRAASDPSKRVGHYVLLEELGRGGMGVVAKAFDTKLHREVAIKLILDTSGAGADGLARFAQEARAAARLQHPAIVTLLEVGEHQGKPFLVMDYVAGRSLEEALKAAPLAPRELAAIVRDLAMALHHAHERGIVHRDVKPHNVLLDGEGKPHLADFGLARDALAGEGLTQTGQVLGTLQYMAPEQASGEIERQGPHTDIYALGAVLYRALAGRPVFEGSAQFSLIKKILFDDPTPPRALDGSIHPDLETIALRCLEKEPERRYPSAEAVADELRRFLAGEAIEARPLTRRERAQRWARRNKLLAAVAGLASLVIAALVIAGAAFAVWSYQQIREQRDAAKEQRGLADDRRQQAETATGEAVREKARAEEALKKVQGLLAQALREKGARLQEQARHQEAWAILAKSLQLEESLAARWALGLARAGSPRCRATAETPHRGRFGLLAWRGDDLLSLGALDPRAKGTSLAWRGGHPAEAPQLDLPRLTWAALGATRLVTVHGQRVQVWTVQDGDPLRARPLTRWRVNTAIEAVALHEPSGRVAVGFKLAGKSVVRVWQLGPGRPRALALPRGRHDGGIRRVSFHPSGRFAVSSALDSTLRVWPVAGGAGQRLARHTYGVNGVVFSDDRRLLVSAAGDSKLMLWSVGGGDRLTHVNTLAGHRGGVGPVVLGRGVAHSAGAREWLLASGSMDRTVRVWRVSRSRAGAYEGEQLATLVGHRHEITHLALSDDGRSLASRDRLGEVRRWDLSVLSERRVLRGHTASVNALAFDPKGELLASGGWNHQTGADPRIALWKATTGKRVGTLEGHTKGVIRLAFHPRRAELLASAGEDGTVRLWDTTRRAQVRLVAQRPARVRALAFNPQGTLLAYANGDRPPKRTPGWRAAIVLSDLRTRRTVGRLLPSSQPINVLAFSPDGALLASGDWDRQVVVWDVARRMERARFARDLQAITALTFSRDGVTVAWGSRLWQTAVRLRPASGGKRQLLRGHRGAVNGLAVHPSLPLLASASSDGTVKLWDLSSGSLVATARGHRGGVRVVAFRPDGRLLASGGQDRTVRLWSLEALFAPRAQLMVEAQRESGLRVVGTRVVPAGK